MENGMQVNILKVIISHSFFSAVTWVEVWL